MPPKGSGARSRQSTRNRTNTAQNVAASVQVPKAPTAVQKFPNLRKDFNKGLWEDIEIHRKALAESLRERSLATGWTDKYRNFMARRRELQQAVEENDTAAHHKELDDHENERPKPEKERILSDERTKATALYEDFMFYSAPQRRRCLLGNLTKMGNTSKRAAEIGNRRPTRLYNGDDSYGKLLGSYVSGLKRAHVGVNSSIQWLAVPYHQLHLITPNMRRQHVGVGENLNRPRIAAIDFTPDEDGIEARRIEVETIRDDTTPGLRYRTHDERRKAETQMVPPTADVESYDRRRTKAGLFISAAETSDDWLTSYDCLGPIRSGYICSNPNIPGNPNRQEPKTGSDEPLSIKFLTTTAWELEESNGRREYHVNNMLSPFSDVDSPPHSPISEMGESTISENLLDPMDLDVDDACKVVPDTDVYRSRLLDHYGITEESWPRVGVEVPYNQLSVRATRTNDVYKKWYLNTMTIPIKELGPPTSGGPISESDDDTSDAEGDLFTISYQQGSNPQ